MTNFIIGFVLGVAACTIGFKGMAEVADRGVEKLQTVVKENAK
jgi:hypothetical protein